MLQLMRECCSYTYPPLPIARYSFIHLSELEQCRVKTVAHGFNTATLDSNPGPLSRESEVLPLSHCALQRLCNKINVKKSQSEQRTKRSNAYNKRTTINKSYTQAMEVVRFIYQQINSQSQDVLQTTNGRRRSSSKWPTVDVLIIPRLLGTRCDVTLTLHGSAPSQRSPRQCTQQMVPLSRGEGGGGTNNFDFFAIFFSRSVLSECIRM